MGSKNHNKILGKLSLVWIGVMLFLFYTLSSWTTIDDFGNETIVLSPSGYIETRDYFRDVQRFDGTVSLEGAFPSNGFTCYLAKILNGYTAWAFQNNTISSITYLAQKSVVGSGEVKFDLTDIPPTEYSFDWIKLVIVPAIDHVFNTQIITVTVSTSIARSNPFAIQIMVVSMILAFPGIFLAIINIKSAQPSSTKPTSPVNNPSSVISRKFCPACGEEVHSGDSVCNKCGTNQ